MNATSANPTLHHVNIKTGRLNEMIDWYGTAVGLTVQHRFEGGAWLTNDEANHRLAFLSSPEISDDPDKLRHAGLHHTAFEFDSLDGLLGTFERLRDRGQMPHACLDHGMTISMYFVDPDGNSVELQCDAFGDWGRSSEFVRDDPRFDADPIGAPFDPAKLLEARLSGASLEDLHERAYGGEFATTEPLDLRFPVSS